MAETSRRWSIVWQRRTRSHVLLGVVVLREAGDRLEPALGCHRELVGRRVENRRARAERVRDRAGDDARRPADVQDRLG